jgi:hypothetical protein
MADKNPRQRTPRLQGPKPTQKEMLALARQFNRTGTQFLKVDVATGLTFAKAARDSQDAENKRRN